MSGFADSFDFVPVAPGTKFARGPETGVLDNLAAGFRSTRAFGNISASRNYQSAAYDPIVKALNSRGYTVQDSYRWGGRPVQAKRRALLNPFGASPLYDDNPLAFAARERDRIWQAVEAERQSDPSFLKDMPDQASFEAAVNRQRRAVVDESQDIASRAIGEGTVANFLGQIGGAFTDPVNAATLLYGGGGTVAGSFAKQFLVSTLKQGTANAVMTAATEIPLTQDAARLGIEHGATEIAADIGLGFAFGAGGHVLATAAKPVARAAARGISDAIDVGTHAGARTLLKAMGAIKRPLTRAERDAMIVVQRELDIADSSPFAPTPDGDMEHRMRLRATVDAIEAGEPVPVMPPPATPDWQATLTGLQAAKGGEAPAALYHPEVGLIDVRWGNAKGGLAHILDQHPEVAPQLPDLLDSMHVTDASTANRLRLESDDHRAVVRLDYDGKAKRWLLTAFRREDAPPQSGGNSAPALTEDGRASAVRQDGSPASGTAGDIGAGSGAGKFAAAAGELRARYDAAIGAARQAADAAEAAGSKDAAGVYDRRAGAALNQWTDAARALAAANPDAPPLPGNARPGSWPPVRASQAAGAADRAIAAQGVLAFDDPHAAAAKLQADGLRHDLDAALAAGDIGDTQFATGGVQMADGQAAPIHESVRTILDALDRDDAAIAALKACL